ncbi:MAG: type II secretion system F family protein [Opitutae bacterium]|nr:type II secretion system F family protein [Opitutae bacterium]
MARFAYTATDERERAVSGAVEAPSRAEAARMLRTRGLHPVRLESPVTVRKRRTAGSRETVRGGYSRRDLLPFLKAILDLTSSGLSAGEAVRLLSVRLKEPALRALCTELWSRLQEGQTLSAAMTSLPEVFDPRVCNLVRASEATGSLLEVLRRLVQYYEEMRDLRQKLRAALAYPATVCVVAFGVILFFVLFLLPRLQSLLASLGGELPLATRMLVGGARFSVRYGLILLPLILLAGAALMRWKRTERGRERFDAILVRLPVLREWVVESSLLGFSQTMSVLIENGINTVEAMRLTLGTVGNLAIQRALTEALARVVEGEGLSAALGRTAYFPDLVLDRLAVGESTGHLAPCLRDIAQHYSRRRAERLERFTGMLSSAILLFAFAFVGFIAYAIVSAVLKVSASFHF